MLTWIFVGFWSYLDIFIEEYVQVALWDFSEMN